MFSGEATLPVLVILAFSKGMKSKMSEFLPRSKFFSLKVDPFWKSFFDKGSKQEVTKVVFLRKMM